MEIITQSAEHHFLGMLEKIKTGPKDWHVLHFAFSKLINHDDIIRVAAAIPKKLEKESAHAHAFAKQLAAHAQGFENAFLYVFADNDVNFLVRADDQDKKLLLDALYKQMAAALKSGLSDSAILAHEIYNYQKLADQKFLSVKRFESYRAMSDTNKISSIALRRDRREAPLVLLIEDDKFTASYTANILGKDYELVVCRTGEEGVMAYIEHAPDIVFLDIHLPGFSGHDTLAAINIIDADAFVVMLSVDAVKESIVRAAYGGAKNFLKKPFSKERLINVVKNSPHIRGFAMGQNEGGSLH